jgi:hypothetical protein
MPTKVQGRACLTFHTMTMKNGQMVANENMSFVGTVSDNGVLFQVTRQLPSAGLKGGLKGMLSFIAMMRTLGKRLDVEAARRGQPVPTVRRHP